MWRMAPHPRQGAVPTLSIFGRPRVGNARGAARYSPRLAWVSRVDTSVETWAKREPEPISLSASA